MKEILAIVEDNKGTVVALTTADGEITIPKADRCHRADFETKAAEVVKKLGGDDAPFKAKK